MSAINRVESRGRGIVELANWQCCALSGSCFFSFEYETICSSSLIAVFYSYNYTSGAGCSKPV